MQRADAQSSGKRTSPRERQESQTAENDPQTKRQTTHPRHHPDDSDDPRTNNPQGSHFAFRAGGVVDFVGVALLFLRGVEFRVGGPR